jgi:purine-binding chemotaxis protein CheW
VVDLASRLALGTTEHARSARVVVVDGGSESIGLLVDGVSEVLRVSASDVEPPSATTSGNGPTAVLGVAKLGERLVLLLDLDAALGGPSMGIVQPQLEAPLIVS